LVFVIGDEYSHQLVIGSRFVAVREELTDGIGITLFRMDEGIVQFHFHSHGRANAGVVARSAENYSVQNPDQDGCAQGRLQ